MWTCKKCNEKNVNSYEDCLFCKTNKNWIPPEKPEEVKQQTNEIEEQVAESKAQTPPENPKKIKPQKKNISATRKSVKKNIAVSGEKNDSSIRNQDSSDKVIGAIAGFASIYLIVAPEMALISIILGVWFWSLKVFGLTILVFMICFFIREMAIILVFALAICWGIIGWKIGSVFSSTGAGVILGIFGLASGFLIHASAFGLTQLNWKKWFNL